MLIRNTINFESVASLAIEIVQLLNCQTGVLNADKSIPLAKCTDELYVAVRFVFHFIFIRRSIFSFHRQAPTEILYHVLLVVDNRKGVLYDCIGHFVRIGLLYYEIQ